MTDRLIVVEAPSPTRVVTVVDGEGELAVAVVVGDRTVSVRSDAGVPATDLIALGDERWLPISYEPPASDPPAWGDITGKPTDLATQTDVSSAIAAVVASSPASLDTLNELASALGDDANFSATVMTALGLRATTAQLATEASTRASADTTLQGNIDAEAATRSAADIALQANIDAEATTRAAAITAEATARATAVSAEATARTAAINAAVAALINSAPGVLDTLGEIAAALQSDESTAAALATSVALKAPIASPAFTGHPTGVTETAGDNSTRLATTAFVTAALAAATPSWTSISSKPTTIAGISAGVATDFNTLGDARWLKQTGGTVYNGADSAATIALNIGAASTQRNALKVWGNIFIGQNNDKIIDSSNSGFLHLGSSGGTTIGYAAGTVILKAVTAGVTLSAPLIIPTGAAPASAGAAGVAGQHAWDSGFLYICTATNTWKRVAVATW